MLILTQIVIKRRTPHVAKIGEQFQSADWKQEKHSPVIECPDSAKAGEKFQVTVSVGKEIAHPNTTEHHIRWIQLFFKPDGDKFSYQLANCEFTAHGESAKGANQGPAFSEPSVTVSVALKEPGTLFGLSFCNIHGLWESSKTVTVS
ncbi:MAG: class II SORL domain-containing protein [Spirochaetales bacterium]|nr:class II SORL domain-containing protein [Spirochaetales bacterium]